MILNNLIDKLSIKWYFISASTTNVVITAKMKIITKKEMRSFFKVVAESIKSN